MMSGVDLEPPVDRNREDLQWENARTEIKPIDKTKIFGDAGTHMLYLALSSVKRHKCYQIGVSGFEISNFSV